MNRIKWNKIGIAACFAFLVLAAAALLGALLLSCTPAPETQTTAAQTGTTAGQTQNTALQTTQTTPPATKPEGTTPPTTKPEGTTPPTTKPGETTPPTTHPKETTPPTTQPAPSVPPETTLPAVIPTVPDDIDGAPTVTLPTETEPNTGENVGVRLPCDVPQQGLRIEKIAPYSGIFVEDGTNRRLENMAMMLVTNTGDAPVEYTVITASYAGGQVEFRLSSLPAGASAVVQAQNAAAVPEGDLLSCTATVIHRGALALNQDKVSVIDNSDGSLTVTNLTGADVPAVRVFYKYYMEEEGLYVGGITFTAKLTGLKAGETLTVRPAHYSGGSSRVMMVALYDTEQ